MRGWGVTPNEGLKVPGKTITTVDQVPANLAGVKQVAISDENAVAILENGTVIGWGTNITVSICSSF